MLVNVARDFIVFKVSLSIMAIERNRNEGSEALTKLRLKQVG
jgi:hypothetical protein